MFDLPYIQIPVAVFLALFGFFMLFYIAYSLFNIYHLVRYGVYGLGLYWIVSMFTAGTILLVAGSMILLSQYDWSQPIFQNSTFEFYNKDFFPGL